MFITIVWLYSYFRGRVSQNLSNRPSNDLIVGAFTTEERMVGYSGFQHACVLISSLECVLYSLYLWPLVLPLLLLFLTRIQILEHFSRRVMIILFNATFNNISVISWLLVLLVGNRSTRRKPPTCRKSLTNLVKMLYRVQCLESNAQEEFEDTKGLIRIRISKNRQYNGKKKKYTTIYKTYI